MDNSLSKLKPLDYSFSMKKNVRKVQKSRNASKLVSHCSLDLPSKGSNNSLQMAQSPTVNEKKRMEDITVETQYYNFGGNKKKSKWDSMGGGIQLPTDAYKQNM